MSSPSVPPRFVPTLTEVVQPVLSPTAAPTSSKSGVLPALSPEREDEIVHRVLQRIDLILDRRLREAVGQVILAHTQTLAPRLREEIELVVRQCVNDAFEQELASPMLRS